MNHHSRFYSFLTSNQNCIVTSKWLWLTSSVVAPLAMWHCVLVLVVENMSIFQIRKENQHWCSFNKWNRNILMMKRKSKALLMWAEFFGTESINSLKNWCVKIHALNKRTKVRISGWKTSVLLPVWRVKLSTFRKDFSVFVTTIFISISFFFF